MRTTLERLAEVYCRPKTEEEWAHFEKSCDDDTIVRVWAMKVITDTLSNVGNRTEIPVPHFRDLLHDRIVPWRLEEDGFTQTFGPMAIHKPEWSLSISDDAIEVYTKSGVVSFKGITTYTDLITLIRLLG